MRLICPNCDAQYNVSDDAIPEGGRDVQCSSCAHTWFQTEAAASARETSLVLSKPLPSAVKASSRDVSAYDTPTNSRPLTDKPTHRPVDPSVANILREEAAREHEVSDSGAWESPATEEARKTAKLNIEETRKRIAQVTQDEGGIRSGASPEAAAAAVAAAANPRAVPDIHEINAALRARADANDTSGLNEAEKQEAVRRSGFRRGFLFVLIIVALLIAPYFFAEEIVTTLPQTSDFMQSYLAVVDQLRLRIEVAVDAVSGLIASFTG